MPDQKPETKPKGNNVSIDRILPILLIGVAVIIFLNLLAVSYPLFVILPLVKALFLVIVNITYGYGILYLLRVQGRKNNLQNEAEKIDLFSAFGMGLIFTGFFFFLAAALQLLNPLVILLYLMGPLPLLLILNRNAQPALKATMKQFFHRPAIEYLVFLFPLIYAALPSSFYDTLAYHLGIPNLYLQHGGFVATPQLFYANTFIYYEIATIPAVFAGDMVPRLFHLSMGVLLVWGVIDFTVEYWGIKKRSILLLTIISMPMTIFLLTAVKNDLPCALFIFLGIRAFLKNKKPQSALYWGFALGVKYTNIVPLAVFLLIQLVMAIKKRRTLPFIKQMILFGLICLAILLPLLAKNYVYTGNPVFPFLHGTFENRIPYWDTSRLEALEKDAKTLFHSITDLLKSPYTLSFTEPGSGGRVGPLYLFFLPFLLFALPWVRQKYKAKQAPFGLLIFALLTLLIGGHVKLSTRVWYIAFLVIAIYVTLAYEWFRETGRPVVRTIAATLFFAVVGINIINAYGLQEYLYRSHDLFTGKVGIREYKTLTFPASGAFAFIEENTPRHARVLLVGEGRSFYLKRPYTLASGYDYSILKKYLNHAQTPAEFFQAMKQDGIDYIVFDSVEFKRLQQQYKRLSPQEADRAVAFLNRLPMLYNKEGVKVFGI